MKNKLFVLISVFAIIGIGALFIWALPDAKERVEHAPLNAEVTSKDDTAETEPPVELSEEELAREKCLQDNLLLRQEGKEVVVDCATIDFKCLEDATACEEVDVKCIKGELPVINKEKDGKVECKKEEPAPENVQPDTNSDFVVLSKEQKNRAGKVISQYISLFTDKKYLADEVSYKKAVDALFSTVTYDDASRGKIYKQVKAFNEKTKGATFVYTQIDPLSNNTKSTTDFGVAITGTFTFTEKGTKQTQEKTIIMQLNEVEGKMFIMSYADIAN